MAVPTEASIKTRIPLLSKLKDQQEAARRNVYKNFITLMFSKARTLIIIATCEINFEADTKRIEICDRKKKNTGKGFEKACQKWHHSPAVS